MGRQMQNNDAMLGMVHSMDKMAKDLQDLMNRMGAVMENVEMMDDPLMNEYMDNMQAYMGIVMDGFDGVLTEMEKTQILNSM